MNISQIKIQLNDEQMIKIAKFEEAIQKKRATGVNQHIKDFKQTGRNLGKLGEEIVATYIGGCVDYNVWETGSRGKHFDADIENCKENPLKIFADKKIHVKTTSLKNINGRESWTTHKKDSLYDDPRPNDIIILVLANGKGEGLIYGYVVADDVYDLWEDCIELRHKVAIYLKTLNKHPNILKPIPNV
jgi:hypothetical protein